MAKAIIATFLYLALLIQQIIIIINHLCPNLAPASLGPK